MQGNVPGASTLSQITPGQTTVEWLLAVAGPPNSRKSVEDGTEIFRYCRTGSSEKEVGIFLLFHLDSSRRRQEAVFVETREGIVQRYWVETDDQ
ncbi:MAG: hypothetical protein GX591_06545 [Planctomycetes bacterium]|nr:hypothetical protein [Planctomycetota bacterium]